MGGFLLCVKKVAQLFFEEEDRAGVGSQSTFSVGWPAADLASKVPFCGTSRMYTPPKWSSPADRPHTRCISHGTLCTELTTTPSGRRICPTRRNTRLPGPTWRDRLGGGLHHYPLLSDLGAGGTGRGGLSGGCAGGLPEGDRAEVPIVILVLWTLP